MESSLFFGGSVVAAMVAGSVSLFAPCCISVMMPAYLSSAFQNRRILVAMTFLFAAGIATVILPIALGAVALQRLLVSEHTLLYVSAGTLMLALAGFVFLGGKLRLPAPGRRAGGATGPLGVYSLGVFSGFASSCCAPVLAGCSPFPASPPRSAWRSASAPPSSSGWSRRSSCWRSSGSGLVSEPSAGSSARDRSAGESDP